MHKLKILLQLTTSRIPWALARFNDGEMRAMHSIEGAVARGDQPCGTELRASLKWAIAQRRDNLFIGVPCSRCFPVHSFRAEQATRNMGSQRTLAVVQTNRNLNAFKDGMTEILGEQQKKINYGRVVSWVSGDDQDVSKLPFDVAFHLKIHTKDAYGLDRDTLMNWRFSPGSIVFLSCGPLATVAAVQLFLMQPTVTFIDVGSVWDPETRGVSHRCHTGKLPACKECN